MNSSLSFSLVSLSSTIKDDDYGELTFWESRFQGRDGFFLTLLFVCVPGRLNGESILEENSGRVGNISGMAYWSILNPVDSSKMLSFPLSIEIDYEDTLLFWLVLLVVYLPDVL